MTNLDLTHSHSTFKHILGDEKDINYSTINEVKLFELENVSNLQKTTLIIPNNPGGD